MATRTSQYDPTNPTDPTDPLASRRALLDQLGPADPLAPTSQPQDVAPPQRFSPGDPTSSLAPVPGPAPAPSPAPSPTTQPTSTVLPVPGAPPQRLGPAPAPPTPTAPSGGSLSDPAYVDQLLAYWGNQPGVNPSVKNDPGYWRQRILSGAFQNDQAYLIKRFMQPEGPPEGGTPPTLSGSNLTNFQIGIDPSSAAYNQQLRDFLTSQLGTLSAPTTANSPDIAPALSAFNNQSQRDQEQQDAATAEQFYANGEGGVGVDSGGYRTALTQGREHAAMNRANFTGSTIYNAAQQKRQQLQEMLNTASQFGMTQQAQQIQAQIAQIDAQLRAQGLSQQNSQFGDQLGFNYASLQAQMNRDAIIAGLSGG